MSKLFNFVIVPVLIGLCFFGRPVFEEVKPVPLNPAMVQTEIKTSGPILATDGSLIKTGYMLTPIMTLNEENLSLWQKLRLKKWDYFDVITDKVAITFAMSDIGYIGDIRLNVFDFTTRQYKTFKKNILPIKTPTLSSTSHRFTNESLLDNVFYTDGGFTLKIENIGGGSSSKYNARKVLIIADEIDLKLNITMGPYQDQEAMVAVIPLTSDKKHFFYSIQAPNMFAEGDLKVGDNNYGMSLNNAGSFIDWGRGVWNYHTYWIFARAQGFMADEKKFSLNLLSGYGDNETMTATGDAFFIDKKLYKLNPIEADFDENNLMNPWNLKTIVTENGNHRECDVVFTPTFVDQKKINIMLIIQNDFRVVYGQFSGWASDDEGNKYAFENVNGYIELFKAKW